MDATTCPGCGQPTERTHWRYDPTTDSTVHVESREVSDAAQ